MTWQAIHPAQARRQRSTWQASTHPRPGGSARLLPTPRARDELRRKVGHHGGMGVRQDCRHYLQRSTSGGDVSRRCRVGANQEAPFACPDDCLFFEARSLSSAGWVSASQPMSNTADGLGGLPPQPGNPTPDGKGKQQKRRRK
jgi:hypothetical protein